MLDGKSRFWSIVSLDDSSGHDQHVQRLNTIDEEEQRTMKGNRKQVLYLL